MRYKRINTLALDVSSVPADHRLSTVQPFLKFLKLDPSKLRSVQVHSSRKTIFIGLPDNYSAAATASKTPRFTIHIDGVKHYVPLVFVDEDVVDVRVLDLPPETPTEVIQDTLRKHGDVLSVISEVWTNFFPGIPTGVRVARMKLKSHIPSFVKIGNHTALIRYSGQEAAEEKKKKMDQTRHPIQSKANNETQPKRATKTDPPSRPSGSSTPAAPNPATGELKTDAPMQIDEPASADFTVVTRKKGRQQQQQQHQQKQQPTGTEHATESTSTPKLSEKDLRTLEIWKDCFLALGIPMLDDAKNKNNNN